MLSRLDDFENTFALMEELRRRVDRAWGESDHAWQGAMPTARSFAPAMFPRVNVYDAGSSLVLKADVPGLAENDVRVTLNEAAVSLSGERTATPPEGYSAHREERGQVKFSRTLQLPCKVDPEHTTGAVKDGVLTVSLSKAAEAQPRQIAVRSR